VLISRPDNAGLELKRKAAYSPLHRDQYYL
jgi:hypothetical protein